MNPDEAAVTLDTAPRTRVGTAELRWRCDPTTLGFETTDDVEPITRIVGQDNAVEALQFGLQIDAPGQNIFVRGLDGSGRLSLLKRMLEESKLDCPLAPDRCVVRNFDEPDRPRIMDLPRGTARDFRGDVDELLDFMRDELLPALGGDAFRERRQALADQLEDRIQERVKPFEKKLEDQGLALVTVQMGQGQQPIIVPRKDGDPVMPEAYDELVRKGEVDDAERERVIEQIRSYGRELEKITAEVEQLQSEHQDTVRTLVQKEARAILARRTANLKKAHEASAAHSYLDMIVEDFVDKRLGQLGDADPRALHQLYAVNVLVCHRPDAGCPVVVESAPTMQNLLGVIDREHLPDGGWRSDHTMVRAGSLLRANGGYLLLEARDLLSEPGAWRVLMRTLRNGQLEIVPPEITGLMPFPPALKPEPAPIQVKVILIGDPGLYYLLDANDPDFSSQFKVLADFETTLPRNDESVALCAGILAKIAREKQLLPFEATAVASLAEYGARIAGRNDRISSRFGRFVDVAYEAAFLARRDGAKTVTGEDVTRAIVNMRRRADLPARKFRQAIADGSLRIQTKGLEVGQVNGLAVVHAGPLTYGFPSRITATIGAGSAGAINIEREAQLSGAIHTKGFYILGGLLRHLLRTPHPLAFSASIAFEQSYGGIDGDSASGAEMCCLLSALTGVPLRQDLAMTGAIDQHGAIQAIGAVTEKIEGFFYTCRDAGLTGTQGVIIPRANARDLMLRSEVVQACDEGQFHVYAVDRIHEALEIFTGLPAGEPDEDDEYAEGTLLARAVEQAWQYWAMISPEALLSAMSGDDEDAAEK